MHPPTPPSQTTPADKVSNFILMIPKLLTAAGTAALLASSGALLRLAKDALAKGEALKDALLDALREALKLAAIKVPMVAAMFVKVLEDAIAAAPGALATFAAQMNEMLKQVGDALIAAGRTVHAAILAGASYAAALAASVKEGIENGAPVAYEASQKVWATVCAGAAQVPESAATVQEAVESGVADAKTEASAAVAAAFAAAKEFCSAENLQRLKDAATRYASIAAGAAAALPGIVKAGAEGVLAGMPYIDVDTNALATALAEGQAAAIAGMGQVAAGAEVACAHVLHAFRLAKEAGTDVANEVQVAAISAIQYGQVRVRGVCVCCVVWAHLGVCDATAGGGT